MKEYDFSNPTLKKSKLFLSSRKNSNELVEIISNLEDVSKIELAHILSIQYIFEELNKNNQLSLEDLSEGEAEYKYRQWLLSCYENSFLNLLNCLSKSDNTSIQQETLTTLLIFTEIDKNLFEDVKLINNKLTDIINVVIKRQGKITNLINILKEHVLTVQNGVTDDMWKCLASVTLKETEPQEHLVVNVISIIDSFPKGKTVQTKDVESSKKGNKKKADENRKAVTLAVNKVWEWCLRHHTSKSLKNLLITLLEHFLPLLSNPTFLTDFLIGTLNKGGATSLLALQGIYTLILKYNINYPNIYGKLYTMLEPALFMMKYKARFFYLLDLFLTSTHLPEKMVASFIKRLARLALKSRPHDILILLPFIGNLLIRHPSLKKLLNHPDGDIQIDNDPFSMEEGDPSRTRALESSLWEVKALQHHVLPSVSRAAMFINEPLPSVEWDLSDKLETTSDKIFDKERKKKMKTTSTTFERPSSLSVPRGFEFSKIWLL